MDEHVLQEVRGSHEVTEEKAKRVSSTGKKTGMEWLYREKQETFSIRLRYLVSNSIFTSLFINELLKTQPGISRE